MLINMALKNRLGENPSRCKKAKFVKNFKSMLGKEKVPTVNLLFFGGTTAFQGTRAMLRNYMQTFKKLQSPRPQFPH